MLKFWNKLNLTSPGHFQIIDFFEMMLNKIKRNFTIYLLLIQNITKLLVHYSPPTQTPTQKFKNEFSLVGSQEISSSLVSFEVIFNALQSELYR